MVCGSVPPPSFSPARFGSWALAGMGAHRNTIARAARTAAFGDLIIKIRWWLTGDDDSSSTGTATWRAVARAVYNSICSAYDRKAFSAVFFSYQRGSNGGNRLIRYSSVD